MLSLLYGGYFYSQVLIITFITSSLGVMISYWSLYAYASYNQDDLPVYDDQVRLESVLVKTISLCATGWLYWSPPDCPIPAFPSSCPPALPLTGSGPDPIQWKAYQ